MKKMKNTEKLSIKTRKFIEHERAKERQERYKKATGCRLAHCVKCGKEIYSVDYKHPLCKECIRKKQHNSLLKEQEELARKLGLIK